MSSRKIIEEKLSFLIKMYKFDFCYTNNRGEIYLYKNKYRYFKYYEWQQFGEFEFSINKNKKEFKVINFFEEFPEHVSSFELKFKGIRKLFKNKEVAYWEMISDLIKLEIDNSKSLFGLKIFD